jgi:hypothetical protein
MTGPIDKFWNGIKIMDSLLLLLSMKTLLTGIVSIGNILNKMKIMNVLIELPNNNNSKPLNCLQKLSY